MGSLIWVVDSYDSESEGILKEHFYEITTFKNHCVNFTFAGEEELLLPYSLGMLKPKYSLNLRPEDCGPPGTPPRVVQQLLQKSNQQNAQSPSTGPFKTKGFMNFIRLH